MTSDSQVTTFTYDFRNRLTEVLIKTSSGVTVQDDKFTYDIENRRIGKNTLSGGQSWTGYDGVNPYADFNSSSSLTYRYLYGNAIDFLLARVDTSGTPMWYLSDKLGSVREDVNTSGSVLDSITYDSYGNILSESSPSSGDRFKYTGREWDSEIGQYYDRARNYGPSIGRFESEDAAGFQAGDTDVYRYCKNDPTNSVDPFGLFTLDVTYELQGVETTNWLVAMHYQRVPAGESAVAIDIGMRQGKLHILHVRDISHDVEKQVITGGWETYFLGALLFFSYNRSSIKHGASAQETSSTPNDLTLVVGFGNSATSGEMKTGASIEAGGNVGGEGGGVEGKGKLENEMKRGTVGWSASSQAKLLVSSAGGVKEISHSGHGIGPHDQWYYFDKVEPEDDWYMFRSWWSWTKKA